MAKKKKIIKEITDMNFKDYTDFTTAPKAHRVHDFEVAVFEDTVKQSLERFAIQTRRLKGLGTFVYDYLIRDDDIDFTPNPHMTVGVKSMGTVEAGRRLVKKYGGTTAILNFADALVPGGLVKTGATTQEENICRCSNLYQSITTDVAKKYYYDANIASFGVNGRKMFDSVYLDNLIYSVDVTFFKDDTTYSEVTPYTMDVITCPAPSCYIRSREKEYEIIGQRAEQIIKSAILAGVDNLVLGAWGCGAFGQDPVVISECFKRALEKFPAFERVVFAIRSCEADSAKRASDNYIVFQDTFRRMK